VVDANGGGWWRWCTGIMRSLWCNRAVSWRNILTTYILFCKIYTVETPLQVSLILWKNAFWIYSWAKNMRKNRGHTTHRFLKIFITYVREISLKFYLVSKLHAHRIERVFANRKDLGISKKVLFVFPDYKIRIIFYNL
jgi:hypothetical protein